MRRHLALLLEISCFVQAVNTAVVKQEALSINAVAVNRKHVDPFKHISDISLPVMIGVYRDLVFFLGLPCHRTSG